MQRQTEFMILDGTMVAIAAIAMTVAHPGRYFPEISTKYAKKMALQRQIREEQGEGELSSEHDEVKHDNLS